MRKFVLAICMVAVLGIAANEAQAQVSFGAQANWATESDLGIGARANIALPVENLTLVPSFDYFFPSTGVTGLSMKWMELNANAHYFFPLAGNNSILPYAGGGLNFTRLSTKFEIDMGPLFSGEASGSESKAGLNLLGGIQFSSFGSFIPFAELRYSTTYDGQLIISGGLNF